jgi:hypothetical protein
VERDSRPNDSYPARVEGQQLLLNSRLHSQTLVGLWTTDLMISPLHATRLQRTTGGMTCKSRERDDEVTLPS